MAAANIRDEAPVSSTANIEVKKAGAEIIQVVPSAIKIDEMVRKSSQTMDYQFPDNTDNDSDKAEVRLSIHSIISSLCLSMSFWGNSFLFHCNF